MERIVIAIVGPTCSGKTDLSIQIAEKLDAEIISCDSRQIYKYLDIGTAKPDKISLQKIKHWFIDMLYPDQTYSAGKFEREAEEVIEDIYARNKIPLVVGGSGLYIKALIDGIVDPGPIDQNIRAELQEELAKKGRLALYEKLKQIDPELAQTMGPQNYKRVLRALEVFYTTGRKLSEFHKISANKIKFKFIQFGITMDRQKLYERINLRVDRMIELGLIDETKRILDMGYSKELNSLNTVGYKEIIEYLENKISLERANELIKRNTRRYAKRQITWFRADERIIWIDVGKENALEVILKSIEKIKNS